MCFQHTHLVIDVRLERGDMFSFESSKGKQFFTRSRMFADNETQVLMANPLQWVVKIESFEGLRTTS